MFFVVVVVVVFVTKESKPAQDRTKPEQQTNKNMELISLPGKSINDEVRQDLASTLQGQLVWTGKYLNISLNLFFLNLYIIIKRER